MMWFGRVEQKPFVPAPERYNVSLVYYTPPEKIIDGQEIKDTVVEQTVIKKEPEEREPKIEVLDEKIVEPVEEDFEEKVEPDELYSDYPPHIIENAEKEQEVTERSKEYSNDELGKEPGQEETISVNYDTLIGELRSKIIEKQVYPYAARKKGAQGVVFVQLLLDEKGNLMEIRVTQSSGHKMLDKAALMLVKKVLPFEHNTGESINIEIPIKYSLVN
jgi:protein TonB